MLLGNSLCNKSYFHCFWELQIASWELFMQQKLFPPILGTDYKLLLGNFLCNKSYFHCFGELQIASWELFMQQKLFPSFLGITNCFLGTFYATKAALVCGTFHLVMKNFGLLFYCFGDYEMVLEKFSCNWGPPRSCGDHVVWDSLNDVLKQMVHYFIVIRN